MKEGDRVRLVDPEAFPEDKRFAEIKLVEAGWATVRFDGALFTSRLPLHRLVKVGDDGSGGSDKTGG